jgi:hypothetical protein
MHSHGQHPHARCVVAPHRAGDTAGRHGEGAEVHLGRRRSDVLAAEGDVVVEGLEHPPDVAGRHTLRRHDHQRTGGRQLLLDPPGHGHVGQADHVVAVHMGHEQRGEGVRFGPRLDQAQDRGPAGVELQGDVAAADQRAGPGASRTGVGHAGPRDDHLGGHGG